MKLTQSQFENLEHLVLTNDLLRGIDEKENPELHRDLNNYLNNAIIEIKEKEGIDVYVDALTSIRGDINRGGKEYSQLQRQKYYSLDLLLKLHGYQDEDEE